MQKTHVVFPNGLWGIDHRWTNRHWGVIQCNPRNGPPDNPTSISTICYPGRSASKFPNHGRKRATRDSQEYDRAQIRSWWHWVPWNVHSNRTFDRTEYWTNVPSEKSYRLGMRQGILNFPSVSMQLKTAYHKYSNVLEPILNLTEITIPPNDRVLIRNNSLLYPENAVTGILQPSDLLHDEGDITFCTVLVILNDGNTLIPVNNFTDHPYKLKKGLHIANFSVMTPEQMKYVNPVDPASVWHLLQNDQEHYVSGLIKTNKNPQNSENYWFPNPENPGNPGGNTRQYRRGSTLTPLWPLKKKRKSKNC